MSIIVKPISGMLTKDTDFFGKMDPYVICMIGNEKKRTQTHSGGGKKPQWTDTLVFNSKEQMMKVTVYDDDFGKDDLVGEATVNLNQLYNNPNRTQNQYVDLVRHGKSSGRVLISMEYQGPGGNGNQQSNWGNNNNGWGGNNQQSNWGGNNQPPNSNWGGNNNGWGNNNQPQNSNWGGNQPPNSNWGGNNNGWGNNNPPQNSNWGGNNQQSNWGGSNQPPNSNWGGNNNGWGNNNQPQNSNWGGNQQSNWGGNNNMNNGPIKFIIKPIEGNLLKDLDTFSKMDPFCAIDIGGDKQRTKAHQGGGKKPKFHQTLTFNSTATIMNVAVFDEDVTTNQLAGQGTYDLSNAIKNMGMSNNEYIDLHKNGKSAGRVLISVMAQQGNNNGW